MRLIFVLLNDIFKQFLDCRKIQEHLVADKDGGWQEVVNLSQKLFISVEDEPPDFTFNTIFRF